jgi:hypothetical protein
MTHSVPTSRAKLTYLSLLGPLLWMLLLGEVLLGELLLGVVWGGAEGGVEGGEGGVEGGVEGVEALRLAWLVQVLPVTLRLPQLGLVPL